MPNDEQNDSLTSGADCATCKHEDLSVSMEVGRDVRFPAPFQLIISVTCQACGKVGLFTEPPMGNYDLSQMILQFNLANEQQRAEIGAIHTAQRAARGNGMECYVLPPPLTIGQLKGN